jgi:hypothetical protein
LRAIGLATLRIASSSVHSILKTLLNLLVVVATVAAITPLSVDRSASGSDYSENKSQRYQSATKSLFHFSPPPFEVEKCNPYAAVSALGFFASSPGKYPFHANRCSGFDPPASKEV